MKISSNWIKELLHHPFNDETIEEILTNIGLEVEGISSFESIKGSLSGIIVGKIINFEKHPNADKLSITKVDIGQGIMLDIVCGAPNVGIDQIVLVATIGTNIYLPEGDFFQIKESKIRGVLSQGMICSEAEIGIGSSNEGILILPNDTKIGQKASEIFTIYSDKIFEIGLTPNRADANSHIGTARDLIAALKFHKNFIGEIEPWLIADLKTNLNEPKFEVDVINKEDCQRYTGVLISNCNVQESPSWLQNRLKSLHVKPINNIVDITNFVMLELGQPLHAYDANKIKHQKIIVTNLKNDTFFIGLDGIERKLTEKDLLICDGDLNPLCLAGIFGGKGSGVNENTKDIFLEAASFKASTIRKTSIHHNLRTESATRFEKGIDSNVCNIALARTAHLIEKIAGGKISTKMLDKIVELKNQNELEINPSQIQVLIGKKIPFHEIEFILRALNFEVQIINDSNWRILIPTYKTDVSRLADVVEEITRIYGLDNIEPSLNFSFSIGSQKKENPYFEREKILQKLSGMGFSESMSLSITPSASYLKLALTSENDLIKINNTSNTNLDLLRPNALISSLETIAHNLSHQNLNIKNFEFGRTYHKNKDYIEKQFISFYQTGSIFPESTYHKSTNVDFFELKGVLESILENYNLTIDRQEKKLEKSFDYSLSYYCNNIMIAEIGKINQSVLKNFNIKQPVYYGQIDWDNLYSYINKQSFNQYEEYSKYPTVRRDLAIVLDESITYLEVEKLSKHLIKNNLKKVILFDEYKNEAILGKNKRSLSLGFFFTNTDKTFEEKQIESYMSKIIELLENKLNAHIRK